MSDFKQRKIVLYKFYFLDFYKSQQKEVKKKIDWTLGLVRDLEIIPEKYFKHIENSEGIFEIRVKANANIFRIFCFFDDGNLVVIANGFQKKTQKTPPSEITKAEKIKKEYLDEKGNE